jgi:hypothetical protein
VTPGLSKGSAMAEFAVAYVHKHQRQYQLHSHDQVG